MKIHVGIVEDHCDVVPFLEAAYRRKMLQIGGNVHLIHFDAHPDLALPTAGGMASLKNSSVLAEVLSTEGGIAEWVLPLFANKLIRHVTWVRDGSTCNTQGWGRRGMNALHSSHTGPEIVEFMFGEVHEVHGAPDADCLATSTSAGSTCKSKLGTTLQSPYYFDDGLVYSPSDLHDACTASVTACDIHELISLSQHALASAPPVAASASKDDESAWILDVCLDYFSVNNPFFLELQEVLATPEEAPTLLHALSIIHQTLWFRQVPSPPCLDEQALTARREACEQWSRLQREVLLFECRGDGSSTTLREEPPSLPVAVDKFLENPEASDELNVWLRSTTSLDMHRLALEHVAWWLRDQEAARYKVLEMGCMCLLPNCVRTDAEIADMVRDLGALFRHKGVPALVTIAQSSDDCYTPPEQLQSIREQVLGVLHEAAASNEHWRDADGTPPVVEVHDLTEDAYSRAYGIFAKSAPARGFTSTGQERKKRLFDEMGIA